jgi:hypothetical protein
LVIEDQWPLYRRSGLESLQEAGVQIGK